MNIDLIECRGAHIRWNDLFHFHIITNPFGQFLRFIISGIWAFVVLFELFLCRMHTARAQQRAWSGFGRKWLNTHVSQAENEEKIISAHIFSLALSVFVLRRADNDYILE